MYKVLRMVEVAVVWTVVAAWTAGCGIEVRDKEQNSETPAVQGRVVEVGLIPMSGHLFQIEEGLEPKSYRVRVQIPEGARYLERIDRRSLNRKKFWVEGREITDLEVLSGESYEYSFYRGPSDMIDTTTVHVPRDLVIDGTISITELDLSKPTRRLYLTPTAVIQTGDTNVEIRVERMLAEPGARFETFAKGSVGGLSGGQTRLILYQGIGELRVELRGQQGRNGASGIAYAARAADGQSFAPSTSRGGSCDGRGRGGQGADGARGRDGADGQNGGATGSFEIVVKDATEFRVNAVFEPGAGGHGGAGGAGQPGGRGGVSEARRLVYREPRIGPDRFNPPVIEITDCPALPNGNSGRDGTPGTNGKDGRPGATGFFCLKENGVCR